ncbi:MAG: hypothetical protein IJ029_04190 [Lachnospiraceae bacterium]|nr:hypothetical protein [Lachnospiraceae bacterium]
MKKKCLSRTVAAMLTGVMAAGILAGCGNQQTTASQSTEKTKQSTASESVVSTETTVSEEGVTYPVDTDEELSLYIYDKGLLTLSSAYADYNEVPFYKGLSEKTGISIDWQSYAEGADKVTAYNLLLQDEELPSIIFGNTANAQEIYTDGVIYDLTDYLETYAPDFWEYINAPENEANRKAIISDEGKFLYFPFIQESDYNITYLGPVIRQDWLDALSLEAPVTLEDWEEVLIAFRDNYGAYFSFPFGRYNTGGGIANGTGAYAALKVNYYVEDGDIKCANTQEEWKNFLEVMNRWYDEGLLDPDFSGMDDTALRSKALNGQVGIAFTAMSQLTNFIADAEAENTGAQWVGLAYPRTEEDAPTTYIYTRSQTANPAFGAVVTTSCSEEELIAAIKFLNYGYSEEGMMYWNFGEEGVSYEAAADGRYRFTETITGDERGIAEALKDYTGMYSAGIGIQMADFVKAKNNDVAAEAVYVWTDNTVAAEHVKPSVTRTVEEQTRYSDINSQLNTYISEMALKFVTGDEPLDNFDKFVEQLDAYGLQELLEIEQNAYERYMNK